MMRYTHEARRDTLELPTRNRTTDIRRKNATVQPRRPRPPQVQMPTLESERNGDETANIEHAHKNNTCVCVCFCVV